jgi:hypothetical protein
MHILALIGNIKGQYAFVWQLQTNIHKNAQERWQRRRQQGEKGQQGAMTVKHVLLICPRWQHIRQEIGLERRDIRWALTTREGASLVIKLVLKTGLLEQFQLYAGSVGKTRSSNDGGIKWDASDRESFGEGTFSRWRQHIWTA